MPRTRFCLFEAAHSLNTRRKIGTQKVADTETQRCREDKMNHYFMQFQVLGEVADMLLMDAPQQRLLVDISTQTQGEFMDGTRPYPVRTCFTIEEGHLIREFQEQFGIGDTIRATGTFSQTDYVPHKTSYIDTTFRLLNFHKIHADAPSLEHDGTVLEPSPGAVLH